MSTATGQVNIRKNINDGQQLQTFVFCQSALAHKQK